MNASDTIMAAGKGAAAGMMLGPIGAAAGALLGAAPGLLDLLGIHLFGHEGEDVAAAALDVLRSVIGKAEPTSSDVAGLPPDQIAQVRIRLAEIGAQQEAARLAADQAAISAQLADVADARKQTVALASTGSSTAWGAPVVSILVVAMFGGVLFMVLHQSIPAGSEALMNVMLGGLGTSFASVVAYWVGSSAGSARKSELLHASAPV